MGLCCCKGSGGGSTVAGSLAAAAAAVGVAVVTATGDSGSEKVKQYDPRTFFETTSVFGASFSPDESRLLITSDKTGIFNAYAMPVDGGAPTQLTFSEDDAAFGVSYFPNDERILVSADEGGDELNHIYVRETDGSLVDLTPGENVKASFAGWREGDQAFFIATNERDPRAFDLYEYEVDGYERRMLFENTEAWSLGSLSDSGRWLALVKNRTNADNDVYVVDLNASTPAPVHITPHEGDIQYSPVTFTPGEQALYYSSNEGGEWRRIWSYDLQTGEKSLVLEDDWDVMGVSFSETGRYRVASVNEDASTRVTVLDMEKSRPVNFPAELRGDVSGINIADSETKMAFYVNSDTSPSNLYVMDLKSGEHRRLTDTLSPKIDEDHLVESTVIRYPSFDDLAIPALLYKPHQASATNKAPALVWVHGGPGGQSRTGYSEVKQLLVNHGYALLAVNNRGSSGYGKTFFHMDDQRHGDVDLKDCVYARAYLESLDWVDGERIGIIGGSYGGYMVAAALAFEPEVFDVGVNIFGVTNWLRTLESIPAWWEAFRESLY